MIYLFLANGFEEIEALTPVDMLRRAGLEVVTVGVGGKVITGAHGIAVAADITTDEALELAKKKPAELVVLPGGMPGAANLRADEAVKAIVTEAHANGKLVAAICAAPSVLVAWGLAKGKTVSVYPGFEDYTSGTSYSDAPVTVDGKLITAKGMGASLDFALELVAALHSREKADELRGGVFGYWNSSVSVK